MGWEVTSLGAVVFKRSELVTRRKVRDFLSGRGESAKCLCKVSGWSSGIYTLDKHPGRRSPKNYILRNTTQENECPGGRADSLLQARTGIVWASFSDEDAKSMYMPGAMLSCSRALSQWIPTIGPKKIGTVCTPISPTRHPRLKEVQIRDNVSPLPSPRRCSQCHRFYCLLWQRSHFSSLVCTLEKEDSTFWQKPKFSGERCEMNESSQAKTSANCSVSASAPAEVQVCCLFYL